MLGGLVLWRCVDPPLSLPPGRGGGLNWGECGWGGEGVLCGHCYHYALYKHLLPPLLKPPPPLYPSSLISHPTPFLPPSLLPPSQVGKTGAWLLMVRLLHDHLRSSQGVVVECPPTPSSIFLTRPTQDDESPLLSNTALPPSLQSQSKCSSIVPLKHLQALTRQSCEDNDRKPIIHLSEDSPKSQAEFSTLSTTNPQNEHRHTVLIPISQYVAYDFTHSCTDCAKYLRGSPVSRAEILTSFLPTEEGGHISLQWHIPTYQQKHCVISPDRKTLERLKLPTLKLKGEKNIPHPLTPIFTPTLSRESSGLFNLFHSSFEGLHVIVTTSGQFERYCKAWPNHIIMALPEQDSLGLGELS